MYVPFCMHTRIENLYYSPYKTMFSTIMNVNVQFAFYWWISERRCDAQSHLQQSVRNRFNCHYGFFNVFHFWKVHANKHSYAPGCWGVILKFTYTLCWSCVVGTTATVTFILVTEHYLHTVICNTTCIHYIGVPTVLQHSCTNCTEWHPLT